MTDRFTEAEMEQQDKSPFICTSCGHPHDIAKIREKFHGKPIAEVHDRFSDAVKESGEKSAFACEICGHEQTLPDKSLH